MNPVFQCPYCSQLMEVDPRSAGFASICPSCHQVVQVPRMATPLPPSGAARPPVPTRPKKKPAPPPSWVLPTTIGAGVCAVVLAGAWIVKNTQNAPKKGPVSKAEASVIQSLKVLAEAEEAERKAREEAARLDRLRRQEAEARAPYDEARQLAEQFHTYKSVIVDLIEVKNPRISPVLVQLMIDCMDKAWDDVLYLYTDNIKGNEPGNNDRAWLLAAQRRMARDPRISREIIEEFFNEPVPDSKAAQDVMPAILKPYHGTGSGFFITKDGWIVTAKHVVEGSKTVEILRNKEEKIPAKVVAMDPKLDVALVKADTTSATWLPLSEARTVPLGRPVLTVGFPRPTIQGLAAKLGNGRISSLEGMGGDPDSFQFSVPDIGPGNSGGPMVESENGWVLGVVTGLLTNAGATNYAVRSSAALQLIRAQPDGEALFKANKMIDPIHGEQEAIKRTLDSTVMLLVR